MLLKDHHSLGKNRDQKQVSLGCFLLPSVDSLLKRPAFLGEIEQIPVGIFHPRDFVRPVG